MSELEKLGFLLLKRVSTQQQAASFGLSWQRTHLPPYGERYLGPMLGDYDEGATSTSLPLAKRPVMLGLLVDLDELRPGYLLVADQDRLARSDDFGLIKAELRRFDVKLAFYREDGPPEVLDVKDEYDDFHSDIHSAVGKLEKAKINKRMRHGKQQAAQEGNAVQPVPYGYFKPEKNQVAICPERGPIAQLIFEKVAAGSSIRKVVQWLNTSGIPSPSGKRDGWTPSYVAKMLRNPAYAGRAEMLRTVVAFPPIVDDETFLRIPEVLERNKTFSKRNNTRFQYLCRSLIECSRCGKAMCGAPRHGEAGYRCNGRLHQASKGLEQRCDQPAIFATPVDDLVWEVVAGVVLNPELIRAHVATAPTVLVREATVLRRKIRKFDDRRQKLSRQHEMGLLDDDELRHRTAEIVRERDQDAARLDELERDAAVPEVDLTRLEEAEQLCRELAPRLAEASFDEKRALVEKLVHRIRLDGKHVTVELVAPLAEALSAPKRRAA